MDFFKTSFGFLPKFSDVSARLKVVHIKYWWAILLSAALHRLPFAFLPGQSITDIKRVCMVLSYLVLFWALAHNWNFRSIRLMTVGAVMNFIAIIANGCLMPVSPEARELAQMTLLDSLQFGKILPEGSGIYLPITETNMWFLTDIIPAHSLGGVFSAGDVLIGFGIILLIVEIIRSNKWLAEGEIPREMNTANEIDLPPVSSRRNATE
jgi:hypothetical protein